VAVSFYGHGGLLKNWSLDEMLEVIELVLGVLRVGRESNLDDLSLCMAVQRSFYLLLKPY